MLRKTSLICLVCVIVIPQLSSPDNAPPAILANSCQSILLQLRPGQRIRIHTDAGGLVEGRFSVYQTDTVFFSHGSMGPAAANAIDSLWVQGGAGGKGARIGAIIGGLGGLVAVAFWNKAAGSESDAKMGGHYYILSAGLGAASGGLLGLGIGSASLQWRLKYSRPSAMPVAGQH